MAKYIVVHPKLNRKVNGKLCRVPVGTELNIDEKEGSRLRDKVRLVAPVKAPEKKDSK